MTYHEIRDRANRVRGIPLEDVLLLAGAARDRYDRAKWHTAQGVISVNGVKFMNWNRGAGGGGAIDLAIHLHGLDFKAAVEWLSQRFSSSGPTQDAHPPLRSQLELPAPDGRALSRVRQYLVRERCLPSPLIEALIESGSLYADSRANAVFLLLGEGNRPVGAELRGTHSPWRGMARGSRKDLGYFSVSAPHVEMVVLCESAIDAVSCFALSPERLCISTAGARPNPGWLPPLIRKGLQVHCGFDADPTGDTMGRAMIALHPTVKRLRPTLHDWNDVLRSQA